MSAELLRAAAAKMRATAQAVSFPDGDDMNLSWADGCRGDLRGEDAEHAATFGHPAVALAVADWLDAVAEKRRESDAFQRAYGLDPEADEGIRAARANDLAPALAVARAYLGETS